MTGSDGGIETDRGVQIVDVIVIDGVAADDDLGAIVSTRESKVTAIDVVARWGSTTL